MSSRSVCRLSASVWLMSSPTKGATSAPAGMGVELKAPSPHLAVSFSTIGNITELARQPPPEHRQLGAQRCTVRMGRPSPVCGFTRSGVRMDASDKLSSVSASTSAGRVWPGPSTPSTSSPP